MGDRRGAHSGLVGKDAPAAAHTESLKGGTQDSPGNRPGTEGSCQNLTEGGGNPPAEHQQHPDAQQDIASGRNGHQQLRRRADALCAAKQQKARQHRENQAHHQVSSQARLPAETGNRSVHAGNHRVDLGGIAHPKGRQNAENTVDLGQEAESLPQSAGHGVHGASGVAIGGLDPAAHRQRGF